MHEHEKLTLAVHEEARDWINAFSRCPDETVNDYLNRISDYNSSEPRIRVWKRILMQEAHRRGLL